MYSTALSGVQGLLQPDTDWVYIKKREAQEIIPGLWLGPFGAARDQEFLTRVRITDALVVRAPEEARIICPKYPEFIHYEVLECRDSPFENIIRFFPSVKQLLDGVLARGGRILVHGNAGMSRSAALVVAYVMERFNLPSDQAHTYVLTRRHCISINEGFRNQIREYEMLHRVQLQVSSGQLPAFGPSPGPHGQKRHLGCYRKSRARHLEMMDTSTLVFTIVADGEVLFSTQLVLIVRAADGRSRGFGFVEFEDASTAQSALMLSDSVLGGRDIVVSKSSRAITQKKNKDLIGH
ncbi:unnamed protein product [Effrenium voratum]|nr:unnamed protein product [Effrenium voratum]